MAGGDGGIAGAPAGLEIGAPAAVPGFIWIIASLPLETGDLPRLGTEHVLSAEAVRWGDADIDRIRERFVGVRLAPRPRLDDIRSALLWLLVWLWVRLFRLRLPQVLQQKLPQGHPLSTTTPFPLTHE